MAGKKRGLGRGLDALLGGDKSFAPGDIGPAPPAANGLREIPVEFIRPGPFQPRKDMDPEALAELAASISAQGVMQPIVVRETGSDRYEIIAGERRWRATQAAGLASIPAIVREVTDQAGFAMSLIENIQREDLNPMEEARALQRLVEEFDLTHQQVADAVGKSRTAVTNYLRLANLSDDVARMVAAGDLEMGHARALLSLPTDQQVAAARQIVNQQLNVRQAEALVRRLSKPAPDTPARVTDADTKRLEQSLSSRLGQPVSIAHTRRGKGRLVISYSSLDELDGILTRFGDLD